MKLPVPSDDDPAKENFLSKLIKHQIDIEDYCSVYNKSSIPPNNKLSTLALQVFEVNASLVNQYSKYRNQLQTIIQKHLDNRHIQETDEGDFTVLNKTAFSSQCHLILNINQGKRQINKTFDFNCYI